MPLDPNPPVVPVPPWPNKVPPVDPDPKAGLLAVLPKPPPPPPPKLVLLLLPKALLFDVEPKPPVVDVPKPVVVLLPELPKRPPPDDELLLFELNRPVPPVLLPPKRPPEFEEAPKPARCVS